MMSVNKDLADATMMIVVICMVLVGTSDFEDNGTQYTVLGVLSAVFVIFGILRFTASKKTNSDSQL